MRHGRALALSYFVLISVVLHVQGYGVVSVLSKFAERRTREQEARAAAQASASPSSSYSEVELTFADPPEPSAEPSADPSSPTPSGPSARRRETPREAPQRREARAPERPRDPAVSQVELIPRPQPSTPPPPPPNAQMQSVDQQLQTNEPRPNDPAFLAQSNHDVSEQTIAALRGLTTPGLESQINAPRSNERTPGDGNEQRSADERDHTGNREQTPNEGPRPTATPSQTPPASSAQANNAPGADGPRGAAGLRGAPGVAGAASLAALSLDRSRMLTGVENFMPAPSGSGAGNVSRAGTPNAGGATAGASAGRAGQGGAGGQNGGGLAAAQRVGVAGRGATATMRTLSPTHAMYEQVFGPEAQRERVEAQLQRSRARGGGYAESARENRMAMENFTPTVRVGNQTALRTAASPFAAYLTAMHRRIHRHFADGFLAGIENAGAASPFNDPSLVTQLEISLERDGRIARLGVVRTSGNAAFDVAALNSVRRGAPYGTAPEAILSGDGRVYIRWGFYRGERQCGTFNAEPYILPSPGAAPPPLRPPPRNSASDHSMRSLPRRAAPALAPRRGVTSPRYLRTVPIHAGITRPGFFGVAAFACVSRARSVRSVR